jgi:hypothetical protein
MRLRHLLAAMAVSVAWGGAAEASPKAIVPDFDRVETAYAQYRYRVVERRPRYRRVVYRNWNNRRPVRVLRYARPYRYAGPYRYARPYPIYRPARVVPYGYYGPAYGYYRPVRYYAGYGRPYYPYYGYGRPYGGISIGVGF